MRRNRGRRSPPGDLSSMPAAKLERYLALTSSYKDVAPPSAPLPALAADPLSRSKRGGRANKRSLLSKYSGSSASASGGGGGGGSGGGGDGGGGHRAVPRKPLRRGARTLPGSSSSACDVPPAGAASELSDGALLAGEHKNSDAAFARSVLAHGTALDHERGALLAAASEQQRQAAAERAHFGHVFAEIRSCKAVAAARQERSQRAGGAVSIQCCARKRAAQRATQRRRAQVEAFVERLATMTSGGAARRIQRIFRGHLRARLKELRRRRIAEDRTLLRATVKLQSVIRAQQSRKRALFKRQRRVSAAQRWGEARTRIHHAVENGKTPAGHIPRNRKASCLPARAATSREVLKQQRMSFWLKNMPGSIGCAGQSSGNAGAKAGGGKQQRRRPKPLRSGGGAQGGGGLVANSGSVGARPRSPGRPSDRPGSSGSGSVQLPALAGAAQGGMSSIDDDDGGGGVLYSTNLTLSGRAAHVEVREKNGALELSGRYYTSSAVFTVRVSEREFRRFGGSPRALSEYGIGEKLALCAAVCKDLWDSDVVFSSGGGAAGLLEGVIIESMPMFGDMKDTLKAEITARVLSRVVDTGEVVVEQGAACHADEDALFFVKTGTLEVTVGGARIGLATKGDFFGERALLEPANRREASVTATTPAELLTLSRWDFESILKSHPDYAANLKVLKAASAKLVATALSHNVAMPTSMQRDIADHVCLRVRTKVYGEPGELVVQQGDSDEDGMYFVRRGRYAYSLLTSALSFFYLLATRSSTCTSCAAAGSRCPSTAPRWRRWARTPSSARARC